MKNRRSLSGCSCAFFVELSSQSNGFRLTNKAFQIMKFLMENPNRCVPKYYDVFQQFFLLPKNSVERIIDMTA